MDDDDDSGLLDIIGDPQALNYFLHGSGCKSAEELTSTDFSASNSNSIFANTSLTDSKSSIKSVQSLTEEESTEGLQLSNNIQFFEDDLESSSIPDLSEDILQKSLQEANITEQILAEEAYLDASIGSSQQFSNVLPHAHSSASLTQATNAASYSGQTLHPIGVTHVPVVPQQVGASFASNTVGVQHGFMQPVGIIPNQHIPTSSHSGSGQIHLIGSLNNQSPVMTINNLDGSHIILKSGQQVPPTSTSGGVLVQSHTPNGNTMFASPNVSPAGQQVTVPFNSGNFQTSLPVHNIIIHRGPAPNSIKGPINIQPKPMQVGQQMSYSVSNLGIHHHRHQGAHCVPGNSAQSPVMGQQIPVTHQRSHNPSSQQSGGSIVIHSPLGEAHTHHNQFLIPAGLSINSSSLQHIQAINTQFVQTQPSHLGPHQVPTEHIMLNRNTGGMVRPSQHYPGQMLQSPGTAVQLVSNQTLSSSGGQVILNQGPSQVVGGQVAQVSPTLLHLSPGQGNKAQGSASSGGSNMTMTNRFTVVNPGTVLQGMGPSFQSPGSGDNYAEQLNDRHQPVVNETHLPGSNAKSNSMFCLNTNSKQQFFCNQSQKKIHNHHSVGLLMKNQDEQSNTTDHSAVSKHLHHHISLSKEALMGLQNAEVEGHPGVLKRTATKQLTKEALFLQRLRKEQERSLQPDRSRFQSLDNACERLFPYHVFQGSLPTEEHLQQVDNEFESAATHLLKKTQAMLNKYRLLLLEDAMRITPSAEMVMLDRMFNQEERAMLTREKRMSLVDPDGYLSEFCCINKFQESCSDENVLSNQDTDADADPTLSDACLSVDDPKDKTSVGKVPDAPFSVPKNNSASHKPNDTSEDKDSLNTDSKLKNTNLLPQKQLFVSLYKLKRKYTECPSDPEASCKTSKKPDPVANDPITIPVSGSNRDAGDVEHLHGKVAGPSQDAACKPREVAVSPGKPFKTSTSSDTVKATVRNVLELKLSAKHFKSDTSSSNSAELQFVKPSAPTLEENCTDKPISDAREGAAETDSVLEAAVNSILEC